MPEEKRFVQKKSFLRVSNRRGCTQCGKFHDFSVIQILREINFGESRSSKITVFAIFGALNIVDLINFSLQKGQNS